MNLSNAALKAFVNINSSSFLHFSNQGGNEQQSILNVLFCTMNHFFGDIRDRFSGVKDRVILGKHYISVTSVVTASGGVTFTYPGFNLTFRTLV
jgi:hypothetical protein